MQKRFLVTITMCLVLTGCMSSDLSYGNCTNLCDFRWWETASTSDVKAEIKSGANVNARNSHGVTPLHRAAGYGQPTVIKLFINAGAFVNKPDSFGFTPLHRASSANLKNLKVLIDAGALVNVRSEIGPTPLHEAAEDGGPDHVKTLIDAGAEVNARDYLGDTPLHKAVEEGKTSNIKLLIAAGADANVRGKLKHTPLHLAVLGGDVDNVKMLLNAGANPNAQNHAFENPFVYGVAEGVHTEPEWPKIANLLQAAGSETKKSVVSKAKRGACIASGLIFTSDCAKY